MLIKWIVVTLSLLSMNTSAQNIINYAGNFVSNSNTTPPAPWQVIQFDKSIPSTQYQITTWDNIVAVEAKANASMSLLARPVSVDLRRTPILCWRWRIDAPLKTADMATKSGDDYAARIYLAFSLPPGAIDFITKAKLKIARSLYGEHVPDIALNYVWDNRYPVGTQRSNAYTERTQMMVLRSGSRYAGAWVTERRNIVNDAIQILNIDRFRLTLLAVAADTDNTGEYAHAGFADLHFVSKNTKCNYS
jgi:hypothetical protein